MTRLARIFFATTFVSALTAIVLGFALIKEAKERSEAVQAVYKIGLKDGEQFARDRIVRAQAEEELIEEARAHIAEEKL